MKSIVIASSFGVMMCICAFDNGIKQSYDVSGEYYRSAFCAVTVDKNTGAIMYIDPKCPPNVHSNRGSKVCVLEQTGSKLALDGKFKGSISPDGAIQIIFSSRGYFVGTVNSNGDIVGDVYFTDGKKTVSTPNIFYKKRKEQTKNVKIWVNAFIPDKTVKIAPVKEIDKKIPVVKDWNCYEGDNRSFSSDVNIGKFHSRANQFIDFDITFDDKRVIRIKENAKEPANIGTSKRLNCKTGEPNSEGKADAKGITDQQKLARTQQGTNIVTNFLLGVGNPLMRIAPHIDWDVSVSIDPISKVCMVSGSHDGFPSYEVYVLYENSLVQSYNYSAISHNKNPSSLSGNDDTKIRCQIAYLK